jgi:hypothetical protein
MHTKQTIQKVFLLLFSALMMPCLCTADGMSNDAGDNSTKSGPKAPVGGINKKSDDGAHRTMYQKHIQKRLDSGGDQTVNTTAIGLGYTYTDKRQGQSKDTIILDLKYAFDETESGSWGVKFGVPYEFVDPGSNPEKYKVDGFSDIRLELNRAFNITKRFRLSAGLGGRFDTAADDELGGGSDNIILVGNASYHINRFVRAKFSLKYEDAVHTATGGKDTRSLTTVVGLTGPLPYHLLWNVSFSNKDNEISRSYSDNINMSLRHLFGEKKLWSVDVATKLPLHREQERYVLGVGISRHF